jgi:Ca2+-transporting ATPase
LGTARQDATFPSVGRVEHGLAVSAPPTAEDGRAVPVQELPVGDAFAAVASSSRGLSRTDAAHRLAVNGRNELPRSRHASPIARFAAQFTDLFAIVLLVAAVLTLLSYLLATPRDIGNLQLSAAIAAVVVLNAVIGFMQEYMAERTAETLQAMVPHRAVVVRDGARVEVPVAELVIGDLVVLEAGDALSADCRVVEAHDLTVNNMALTGESDPVGRDTGPAPAGIARLEARNLVWMGTVVSGGTGRAVVVATGAATEFGRIFRLTTDVRADRSPLQRQIAIMARRVAVAAFALGALLASIRDHQ